MHQAPLADLEEISDLYARIYSPYLRERGMCHATVWTFSYLESEAPAVALYRRAGATVARPKMGWEKAL